MQALMPHGRTKINPLPDGRVLIISRTLPVPESLKAALDKLQLPYGFCRSEQVLEQLKQRPPIRAAVIILENTSEWESQVIKDIRQELAKDAIGILVWSDEEMIRDNLSRDISESLVHIGKSESNEMLQGRLATLLALRPTVQELLEETDRLHMLSQPLGAHFTQVDEEMRLASRLQRDFLPRELPRIEGLRFATIYRPASWVSGDIYDIVRLDEEHIGFYVADAVGHGMPAALLTIFIKRALIMKNIDGHDYTLIDAGTVLEQLNRDMVEQDLNNFQFATCCYGLLNTITRQLCVASAGHPPPMVINREGQMSEIEVAGSLLGVFPDQIYDTVRVQLDIGDKLLLYSDGVEQAFVNAGPDSPLRFRQEFGEQGHCDIKIMCEKLLEIIDRQEGSLHPRDDVTILGIELVSD